jgi:opacity protein-like surface antigen
MLLRSLLLIVIAACASAQPFSIGVKVGAPLTDAFDAVNGRATFLADTHRFTVGPTVELKLPFGFGIEVDALYRNLEYNYNSGISVIAPGDLLTAKSSASSWQFPVLAKYRMPIPLVKPYAVGGLAFNRLSSIKQTLTCQGGCARAFSDVAHNSNVGVILGAGLQINALLLKISPEIRYTRWGVANFDVLGAFGSSLKSNQNQADVLVGFTF